MSVWLVKLATGEVPVELDCRAVFTIAAFDTAPAATVIVLLLEEATVVGVVRGTASGIPAATWFDCP